MVLIGEQFKIKDIEKNFNPQISDEKINEKYFFGGNNNYSF